MKYQIMVKNDVLRYLDDLLQREPDYDLADLEPTWENASRLSDECWALDDVTGNASGSYTFSRAKAREHVLNNFDTVVEACKELCDAEEVTKHFLNEDWEWFDVIARCYVLGEACEAALTDFYEAESRYRMEIDIHETVKAFLEDKGEELEQKIG